MTTYFDRVAKEIAGARELPEHAMAEPLEAIERRLVFDLTVAAELPGFPDDLRAAVDRVALRYGVATLPEGTPRADFEFNDEYAQRLADMNQEFHSIFHAYARRADEACSDDPLQRVRLYYENAQERRAAAALERSPRSPPTDPVSPPFVRTTPPVTSAGDAAESTATTPPREA